jgi:hypothetical protein
MKKAVGKRIPKSQTIQLTADEPWDTLAAQILLKISVSLNPSTIQLSDYDIMCYVTRVLPKPGITLSDEANYSILLQRVAKVPLKADPTVIVTITQNGPTDKDTEQHDDDSDINSSKKSKKKGQRRDPATLPGNVNKNHKIQELRAHWTCPKQTSACVGTHCFIDAGGSHIPLSHERFDCWASAMVCIHIVS